MPLTAAGRKVEAAMEHTYGEKKGEKVLYASINKGVPGSEKWHGKSKSDKAKRAKTLKDAMFRKGWKK